MREARGLAGRGEGARRGEGAHLDRVLGLLRLDLKRVVPQRLRLRDVQDGYLQARRERVCQPAVSLGTDPPLDARRWSRRLRALQFAPHRDTAPVVSPCSLASPGGLSRRVRPSLSWGHAGSPGRTVPAGGQTGSVSAAISTPCSSVTKSTAEPGLLRSDARRDTDAILRFQNATGVTPCMAALARARSLSREAPVRSVRLPARAPITPRLPNARSP